MTGFRLVHFWSKKLLKVGSISIGGGSGVVWTDYHFSKEEIRVLTECDHESFYYRALPLATIFSIGTYQLVRKDYLKPNKIWGPTPKVLIAMILGYVIGKYSYMSVCMEKLMDLPDSELGFMLRQARKRDQDRRQKPLSHPREKSLDLDKDQPSLKGLDKMFEKDIKTAKYRKTTEGKSSDNVKTQDIQMKVVDECQINREVQHKDCINEAKPPTQDKDKTTK